MRNIKPKISSNNSNPSPIKFFIHIFFNLFCDLLLIWTMHHCMINYMLCLMFSLFVHLWIFYFYCPFLLFLLMQIYCHHLSRTRTKWRVWNYYIGDNYLKVTFVYLGYNLYKINKIIVSMNSSPIKVRSNTPNSKSQSKLVLSQSPRKPTTPGSNPQKKPIKLSQ